MPRFDRLEFGSESQEPRPGSAAAPATPVEDERQALKQADACRRLGQYENALRLYSRALEYDKSLLAGWVGQVQMLIQLDELPEADLWCRKALELFPKNGELLAARAQAMCRLRDMNQAGAACDGAMASPGQSAYRWMVRGEWMLASRQTADAHCFDKARQIDGDWLVPLEIALILLHYRSQSKALAQSRRATEAAPEAVFAWYVRGCAEQGLDMARAAAKSFGHCLELCPGHADARRKLAELNSGGWSLGRILRRLTARD